MSRLAQPLQSTGVGQKVSVLDVSAEPRNDSGGPGHFKPAVDMRSGQMLRMGGARRRARVEPLTIKLMTSARNLARRVAGAIAAR